MNGETFSRRELFKSFSPFTSSPLSVKFFSPQLIYTRTQSRQENSFALRYETDLNNKSEPK